MTGTITQPSSDKIVLLTIAEVTKRVPYSVSSIYRLMPLGRFPKPVAFGEGRTATVRWLESEIEEWILSRIRARDEEPAKQLVG